MKEIEYHFRVQVRDRYTHCADHLELQQLLDHLLRGSKYHGFAGVKRLLGDDNLPFEGPVNPEEITIRVESKETAPPRKREWHTAGGAG